MINPRTIKGLFKPKHHDNFSIQEFLNIVGIPFKDFLRIIIQDECSKSIDETCINDECPFNLIDMHDDELYLEVFMEVELQDKEVKERTKRDYERIYGKPYVND